MVTPKRALLICGLLCAAVGLAALVYDLFLIAATGYDMTDVAGVIDGYAIEWPTGERPPWTLLPAYAYALALLLLAGLLLYGRRRIRASSPSRVLRGAE
jgi:hypothetical protein